MNDAVEHDVLRRMSMRALEEQRFSMLQKQPHDDVILPLRGRSTCWQCKQSLPGDNAVLWHQWVHTKEYNGFLDGKRLINLPQFNFYFPCPFSTCHLKFYHLIDAKFHYLMAHQSCRLSCCGIKFDTYEAGLMHLHVECERYGREVVESTHYLNPGYFCVCHSRLFPTRDEYTAHLQARDFKCADPACHMFFGTNDSAVTHLFNRHYKHVRIGFRKVLLSYELFVRYSARMDERRDGRFHCAQCYRRFNSQKSMEEHLAEADCNRIPANAYHLLVPCKCGHQFLYCSRQRDMLLKTLPPFREALEHLAREAPYSNMEDVYEIYNAMTRVIYDVNYRLNGEKYANYQRGDPFEHNELTANQVAMILIAAVEYFLKIM